MKNIANITVPLCWIAGLVCGTYLIAHDHWFLGLVIAFMGLCPSVTIQESRGSGGSAG